MCQHRFAAAGFCAAGLTPAVGRSTPAGIYLFSSTTTPQQKWDLFADFVQSQDPSVDDQIMLRVQVVIAPDQTADAALAAWRRPSADSAALVTQVSALAPAAMYTFIGTYLYQNNALPTKVAATVIRKALDQAAPTPPSS